MSNHITEIIPDMSNWPDWMVDAFRSGSFFEQCRIHVERLQRENEALKTDGSDEKLSPVLPEDVCQQCGKEITEDVHWCAPLDVKHWKESCKKAYEYIAELQARIEELEKPVLPEDVAAVVKYRRNEHGDHEIADLIERLQRENAALMDENVWLQKAEQKIAHLEAMLDRLADPSPFTVDPTSFPDVQTRILQWQTRILQWKSECEARVKYAASYREKTDE